MEGTITEVLSRDAFRVEQDEGSVVNAQTFRVKLDNSDNVLAYLPVRRSYVKILPGDRVRVKFDSNSPIRGRITYRFRQKKLLCREYYHKIPFLGVS